MTIAINTIPPCAGGRLRLSPSAEEVVSVNGRHRRKVRIECGKWPTSEDSSMLGDTMDEKEGDLRSKDDDTSGAIGRRLAKIGWLLTRERSAGSLLEYGAG
jgi:hypothetical protein